MAYLHSKAQVKALTTLFNRYIEKIAENPDALSGMPMRCQPEALTRLCNEAISNMVEYPFDKLNRWLGFIQGILAAVALVDVDEEREFSRPLLHAFHESAPPSFSS